MKTLEVTAAIIRQNGKILICQRPAEKNCGLLWEFPGGKIEGGETGEQCIVRECQEELGVTLSVERELTDITYDISRSHCAPALFSSATSQRVFLKRRSIMH